MRGLNTRVYEAIPGASTNPNNLDIYNEFVDDEDDTNIIDPTTLIPQRSITLERSNILNDPTFLPPQVTPFQKDVIEGTQDQDFTNFENALFASAKTKNPLDYRMGISDKMLQKMLESGFNLDGTEMTPEQKKEYEKTLKDKTSRIPTEYAADGGMIGGGIMDAAGRQQYFLGKLVKKAGRALKKIVKSPIGKIGLGAALAFTPFKGTTLAKKFMGLSDP